MMEGKTNEMFNNAESKKDLMDELIENQTESKSEFVELEVSLGDIPEQEMQEEPLPL